MPMKAKISSLNPADTLRWTQLRKPASGQRGPRGTVVPYTYGRSSCCEEAP